MKFLPNRPAETREPVVVVDAGLPPGRHRFSLVVVDSQGRASAPDEVVVTVLRHADRPGVSDVQHRADPG